MNTTRLKIKNAQGHFLNAHLDTPEGAIKAYAIFGHCFTCSGSIAAARNISLGLASHAIAVLRFDFTGLGLSKGTFTESHFSGNVSDLQAVHAYMRDKYEAPSILVGHSLGGAAVLAAAATLPAVKAVATVGAPAETGHVKHLFQHQIDAQQGKENYEITVGGRPFQVDKDFVADFDKMDLPHIIKQLKKPLLVAHAPFDTIVGIDNAQAIFVQAKHPKSFLSLDDADHLLSQKEDSVYAGRVIGCWAERYI